MNYGTSCDGGLLGERRTAATAPTAPLQNDNRELRVMCECPDCTRADWFAWEQESRKRARK